MSLLCASPVPYGVPDFMAVNYLSIFLYLSLHLSIGGMVFENTVILKQ